MTIVEARKRLKKAVKNLNEIQDSLVFCVVESDSYVGFENHGKRDTKRSFGAYEHVSVFDDYKKRVDAYITALMFAELIIAASRLNDPKAYHNILNHG